jgi:sulfur carrier protein
VRIVVNGEPRQLPEAPTVGQLVDGEVADRRGVAVAVDGEVVPRRDWDQVTVADGARVELVGAVQGG